MGWRDELKRGRFRDAPFSTEQVTRIGGRRNAQHSYPLRDSAYVEDLGRKVRQLPFDCFVYGQDYMAGRDLLISALEKGGSGKLINPYQGEMLVKVEDYTVVESTRNGGRADFSITFIEAGGQKLPSTSVDSRAAVRTNADELNSRSKTDFARKFSVSGRPDFVSNSAANRLGALVTDLNTINGRVSAASLGLTDFTAQIDAFNAQITTLVTSPADLANDVVALIAGIGSIATSAEAAFSVYGDISDYGDDAPGVVTTTDNRIQEAKNQEAITNLVKSTIIAESSRAVTNIDFEENAKTAATDLNSPAIVYFTSHDDAIRVRNDVAGLIDTMALSTLSDGSPIDDDVYKSLLDLRASLAKDVSARGADLKRLITYTPLQTLPAAIIAYQLYGDPNREAEIIARNKIRHPLFVMGGRPLEVLAA